MTTFLQKIPNRISNSFCILLIGRNVAEKGVAGLLDESYVFFENCSGVSASVFIDPVHLCIVSFSVEKKAFNRAAVIAVIAIIGIESLK